ncbi:hypothetical protein CRE_10843 [Caenorhabditis remanei]|uniref:Uncharacterized protein n=1 Tax=Caenorhabditis remanei TaxID=31234 RepID=E3M551_CAERE|nr:hypothetical protein CRE_10843 [Caenorhabditis remanei]
MTKMNRYTVEDKEYYLNLMRSSPAKKPPEIYRDEIKKNNKCPDVKTLRRWQQVHLGSYEIPKRKTKKVRSKTSKPEETLSAPVPPVDYNPLLTQMFFLYLIAQIQPNVPIEFLLFPGPVRQAVLAASMNNLTQNVVNPNNQNPLPNN